MFGYLRQRTITSAISFAGLVILVFFLSRLTGDPTALYLPLDASLEMREQFRALHGLDQPLMVQFWAFLQDLVRLDFGESIRQARPAIDVVLEAFPWTLSLAGMTIALVAVGSAVVGSLAAFFAGSAFDRGAVFLSLACASTPDFWIAIVAIMLFSVNLGWVPTSGTGSLMHWILPVAVLFIRPFGLITQVVRGAMLSALSAPYVKTARAKGVRDRAIIFVHALRNAMLPIITVIGDQAAGLLNGAVVVETIFGFPGVGRLMINSILQRDFAVVVAAVVVTAAAIFLMNLIIDMLYAILDPRIRH
jgi:peptide/nickel transport system permease protein